MCRSIFRVGARLPLPVLIGESFLNLGMQTTRPVVCCLWPSSGPPRKRNFTMRSASPSTPARQRPTVFHVDAVLYLLRHDFLLHEDRVEAGMAQRE